jgi:hypothetical protein
VSGREKGAPDPSSNLLKMCSFLNGLSLQVVAYAPKEMSAALSRPIEIERYARKVPPALRIRGGAGAGGGVRAQSWRDVSGVARNSFQRQGQPTPFNNARIMSQFLSLSAGLSPATQPQRSLSAQTVLTLLPPRY